MTQNGGDVRAAKRFRTDATVTEVGMRHVHPAWSIKFNGLKVFPQIVLLELSRWAWRNSRALILFVEWGTHCVS